jgi:hypothetical protein
MPWRARRENPTSGPPLQPDYSLFVRARIQNTMEATRNSVLRTPLLRSQEPGHRSCSVEAHCRSARSDHSIRERSPRSGLNQGHDFVGVGDAPAPGINSDVDLPAGLQPTLVDVPVDQPFTGVYIHRCLSVAPLRTAGRRLSPPYTGADDHKAYYPGSHRVRMRYKGDRQTGRLLGLQLFGHRHAEVAKRMDITATAIFNEMTVEAMSDLDLS